MRSSTPQSCLVDSPATDMNHVTVVERDHDVV